MLQAEGAAVSQRRPLSVYIHIPFCARKCQYCDFLSQPAGRETQTAYVAALLREIHMHRGLAGDYQVKTIYFGGGTPSILPGEDMVLVLGELGKTFEISPDAEITVEANPGTVTQEKLACYRDAGVNRLSFGLQSVNDRELRLLGRIHTYRQFLESWELSGAAGFQNRNIDLMSALPGQTVESWETTLSTAVALAPEHISAYSLIIEEGTPFYKRFGPGKPGESLLPDEDSDRLMYHRTKEILGAHGYERYEISNYAKSGHTQRASQNLCPAGVKTRYAQRASQNLCPAGVKTRFACRHNISYWVGTEYLGIGLGASSYLKRDGRVIRCKNQPKLQAYLELTKKDVSKSQIHEKILEEDSLWTEVLNLSQKDQMEEFMFLGLRMTKGISFARFQKRFGIPFVSVYGKTASKLIEQGLLDKTKEGVCLTEFGTDVSNYVFSEFLIMAP